MATHIEKMTKKCSGLLGVMAKASHLLDQKLLLMMYTAVVRSQLEYASGLLITASKTQLEKLNRIQKSAARIILGAPRLAHSAPLIEQLGLQSLEERRMDHVFNIVRSIIVPPKTH